MDRRIFLKLLGGGIVLAATGCESTIGWTVLDFMKSKGIAYKTGVRQRNGQLEPFIEEILWEPEQPQEGRFWLFSVVGADGQPKEIDLPPDQYVLRPGDHATWTLSDKYKNWTPT